MRSGVITDLLKVIVGLYIGLVLLWLLIKAGKMLPNGFGSFFAGAQKLATPST